MKKTKIAVVHEWFVDYSGSERVVEQILNLFPEADLFAVIEFLPDSLKGFIKNKKVNTTFIQKLPFAKKHYKSYLPLMPLAIEQLDLSDYNLVISSSHAVSKGVLTGANQLHISYIHSPIRYAWDLQHQYLKESGLNKGLKGMCAKIILHYMRIWDYRTSNSVDCFVANSEFIAKRIYKTYRREAKVIYPPVNTDKFSIGSTKEDFYLTVSRLVPYKKINLIVRAFSAMPEKKLVIIGDGSEFEKISRIAGENILILGFQDDSVIKDYMQKAKAFIFAAEEDFGITPVEAQACGTPVIAFGKGGALETVKDLSQEKPTGIFFSEQTEESIINAVNEFEKNQSYFKQINCRENALKFQEEVFLKSFLKYVEEEFFKKFGYKII